MADDDAVLTTTRDHVLVITLNRPAQLNAHNMALRDGLVAALDRFEADEELRVAVLTGNGRAFSAGADLKEGPPQPGEDRFRHFDRLDRCAKPIIACLHGYAVGGGLELALCCDVRIATEDAMLGTPEARAIEGIPAVAVHRLSRLMPLGEALKLMLSTQPITGRRAHDVGLVQEVAADRDALLTTALHLAAQMAEAAPRALARIKQIARTPVELEIATSQRLATIASIGRNERPEGSWNRSEYLRRRKEERAEGSVD